MLSATARAVAERQLPVARAFQALVAHTNGLVAERRLPPTISLRRQAVVLDRERSKPNYSRGQMSLRDNSFAGTGSRDFRDCVKSRRRSRKPLMNFCKSLRVRRPKATFSTFHTISEVPRYLQLSLRDSDRSALHHSITPNNAGTHRSSLRQAHLSSTVEKKIRP